jgi:hypothetical protein
MEIQMACLIKAEKLNFLKKVQLLERSLLDLVLVLWLDFNSIAYLNFNSIALFNRFG